MMMLSHALGEHSGKSSPGVAAWLPIVIPSLLVHLDCVAQYLISEMPLQTQCPALTITEYRSSILTYSAPGLHGMVRANRCPGVITRDATKSAF